MPATRHGDPLRHQGRALPIRNLYYNFWHLPSDLPAKSSLFDWEYCQKLLTEQAMLAGASAELGSAKGPAYCQE